MTPATMPPSPFSLIKAQRQGLPIGIQGFAKMREKGCYCVDKTPYALRLIRAGGHYFLSRPRRCGKSLFLYTLKEQGQALHQIKDNGCADPYRARGEPIHLIGVEFSKDSRTVVDFKVETVHV